MAERTRQVEETTVHGNIPQQSTKRVVTTTNDTADETVLVAGQSTAERIIWFVAGTLLTILTFRFILSLLGANRNNGFADFIYSLSYPFVVPFFGLFNYKAQYGIARFEIETLVAMFFYAILAAGIVQLIKIVHKEP